MNNENGRIKIARIKIQNILGIESLEITPTGMTVIEGTNGTGKTSTLEAIKSVIEGGHDATLLRNGTDRGEVVIVLDDGVEITKKITQSASTTDVRHPEFGKLSKPKSYLEKISNALSVNPVQILLAPPKKRLDAILEAMPLKVDEAELESVFPGSTKIIDCSKHALEVLSQADKAARDQRTGVNRSIKDKQSTISQMELSMPERTLEDWPSVVSEIESEMNDLQISTTEAKGKIVDTCRAEVSDVENEYRIVCAEIDREAMEKKESSRKAMEEKKASSISVRDEKLAKLRSIYEPTFEGFTTKLAEAKSKAEVSAKSESMRNLIDKLKGELSYIKDESSMLSDRIQKLEELKTSKLESIPIKGLEIRDGEIFLDGITFDRLNQAKKVFLCVQIARLRAGSLPLVCIDDMEHLDSNTFKLFQEEIFRSGMQAIVTRVSDKPFSINDGEAVA